MEREPELEYVSPVEPLVRRIPVGIGPGDDPSWDRVFRVLGCFLLSTGLAEWVGCLVEAREGDEVIDRLVALLPENRRFRFRRELCFWASKEAPDGAPDGIGLYLLRQSIDDWVAWFRSGGKDRVGLMAHAAGFLARHQDLVAGGEWERLVGLVDPSERGDVVAASLYRNGVKPAHPAVLAGLERCEREFSRFLVLQDLCEVDFGHHAEMTRKAALASLDGSAYSNNHQVPARWLATHFPEEATEVLSGKIRGAAGEDSAWSNWGTAAAEALEVLGSRGEPILRACEETKFCDTVYGGAAGAVRGGTQPPHPRIEAILRRLLRVGDPRWTGLALAEMVKWNPEGFRTEIEALERSADPELRSLARLARADIATRGIDDAVERRDRVLEMLSEGRPGIEAAVRDHLQPCLHLRSAEAALSAVSGSHFGGRPSISRWPTDSRGKELPFLARLVEDDLQKIVPDFRGDLLFFADWENAEGAVRCLPAGEVLGTSSDGGTYPFRSLVVEDGFVFPEGDDSWERWRLDRLREVLEEPASLIAMLAGAFEGRRFGERGPVHRAFGYPRFVQHSPKAMAAGSFDPRETAPSLEEDWVSLLSVETAEGAGIGFYDTGTMTFLVPASDWREQNFERVYLNVDYL